MSILHTPLCKLLNIELPIIQAPIGGAAGPALAAAVSNAGGLGVVTQLNVNEARQRSRETRKLTDRTFAVNQILRPQNSPELDIENRMERLKASLDEGAQVVALFWDDPSPYVELIHSAGALITHSVGSVEEARAAVDAGVDVIVAQGWEAGGHVKGDISTLALVPRVVDAVSPTPVVAAGGIADGRGVAAALVLGAAGVYVGTRFLVSEESDAHPIYKEKVLRSVESDTLYSGLFDIGWPDAPVRTLRNSTVAMWEAAGRPPSGQRPGEGDVIVTLEDGRPGIRYASGTATSAITGDIEAMALWAGQGVGLATRIQPAGEIVRELAQEAESALRRFGNLAQAAS